MSFAPVPVVIGVTAQAYHASPLGRLLLARSDRGLVGAWFEGQKHHPPELDAPMHAADPMLLSVMRQLDAYFGGAAFDFDVPLDAVATPFQRDVWRALGAIPRGATTSYAEVARRIGRPAAVRAVGSAIGRNPLSIIVPCHRVIGSDGTLTGYAGGVARKMALLELERGALPSGRLPQAGIDSPNGVSALDAHPDAIPCSSKYQRHFETM